MVTRVFKNSSTQLCLNGAVSFDTLFVLWIRRWYVFGKRGKRAFVARTQPLWILLRDVTPVSCWVCVVGARVLRRALRSADLRVESWPLMETPYPTLVITVAYILLIWLLLAVMKCVVLCACLCVRTSVGRVTEWRREFCLLVRRNRKEMELKTAVMLHNIFLIALSLYMGIEIGRQAWINDYKFVCNRVDRSPSGLAVERVRGHAFANAV